ncbi:T9SS type A sorting domain-containing protein [Owenweeksia hongkongensis]|uniref:T9SS type A sorting domain-containing protein n=1 Tax=Owenweeksia hongkongensis TaxID=253245 RepID=UPI003A8D5F45
MKRDSVVFLTAPDLIERKYPSNTSWQQLTNGLSIFHVYEHFNLNQNLFICTSVGVFKTEDYGNNWSDFNNGWLDPMNINPVNMAVFGDTLFVASHSEGVYKQAIPAKSISINELSKASESVKLYPNPATDNITITLKDASGGTYKILDQGGKLLGSGSFENGEKLVLPNLADGLYIISIEGSNNTYVKKLKIGK